MRHRPLKSAPAIFVATNNLLSKKTPERYVPARLLTDMALA